MHDVRPVRAARFAFARGLSSISAFALSAATALPAGAAVDSGHARYAVRSLGSLGGAASSGNSIDDLGWVTGASFLSGNATQHAALWLGRLRFDLGTLGGPNSAVDWPVKNDRGNIVGNAENGTPDPLGENFCRYGTGSSCLGFVWRNGEMTALPTLGGNNGYAAGMNNVNQIVGWAETNVRDGSCTSPQVLQYLPVVWTPTPNHPKQFAATPLTPLPGDNDGAAVAANDRGEVVGISGPCADADGAGALHAVLWKSGVPVDLGNFGGTIFNTADAINARGDVVGFSELPGNASFHAFLWTRAHGIVDLKTLPGDTFSEATGINDRDQIVGGSCDANFNCRAVLWENGTIVDLNRLVPPLSGSYLTFAGDIDERGTIGGSAYDMNSGLSPAFVATPTGDARAALRPSRKVTLPESVRTLLRRRLTVRARTLGMPSE